MPLRFATKPDSDSECTHQMVYWYETRDEAHVGIKEFWKVGWHIKTISYSPSGVAGKMDVCVVYDSLVDPPVLP